MALTPTQEAQVLELINQQAALLSLAGNEATITSKLAATKVNLSQLSPAASLSDSDLMLVRQGVTDKSATGTAIKGLITSSPNTFTAPQTFTGGIAGVPLGFRNRIINGDMRIDKWNNGASVNITANVFVVDRFKGFRSGGAATITGQRSTAVPTGFNNSVVLTVGTGATPGSTDYTHFDQNIEGYNVADLGWGTANAQAVTLSFWVSSSLTGTFGVAFRNDAGNRSYVASYTISAANTFEYKTIVIPGDTTGTWLTDNNAGIKMNFDMGVGSTYSNSAGTWAGANYFGLTGGVKLAATAGATFYITGVQLEAGTVATPFERRDYGRELMMCQRYLPVMDVGDVISGYASGPTSALFSCPFQVSARTTPSGVTATSITTGSMYSSSGGNITPTSISWVMGGFNSAFIQVNCASGVVAGNGTLFYVGGNKLLFSGCEL